MTTRKAKVVGCKKLSLIKDPSPDYMYDSDIVAKEIPEGTILEVEIDQIYYHWDDRQYYKVWTSAGLEAYAITTALEFIN